VVSIRSSRFARRFGRCLQVCFLSCCEARQDNAGIAQTPTGSCRASNFYRQVKWVPLRAPAGTPACILTLIIANLDCLARKLPLPQLLFVCHCQFIAACWRVILSGHIWLLCYLKISSDCHLFSSDLVSSWLMCNFLLLTPSAPKRVSPWIFVPQVIWLDL
jgi:hypothetical protein